MTNGWENILSNERIFIIRLRIGVKEEGIKKFRPTPWLFLRRGVDEPRRSRGREIGGR